MGWQGYPLGLGGGVARIPTGVGRYGGKDTYWSWVEWQGYPLELGWQGYPLHLGGEVARIPTGAGR